MQLHVIKLGDDCCSDQIAKISRLEETGLLFRFYGKGIQLGMTTAVRFPRGIRKATREKKLKEYVTADVLRNMAYEAG